MEIQRLDFASNEQYSTFSPSAVHFVLILRLIVCIGYTL